jgi:hypothetical protein
MVYQVLQARSGPAITAHGSLDLEQELQTKQEIAILMVFIVILLQYIFKKKNSSLSQFLFYCFIFIQVIAFFSTKQLRYVIVAGCSFPYIPAI